MYEYIAYNNPQGALGVLRSYGYRIRDKRNLGGALRKLVAEHGEPALRKITELHPDKELIMDVYSHADGGCGCGCNGNSQNLSSSFKENFYGADGAATQPTKSSDSLAMQTNTFLLVATIIIAAAIITSNK